MRQSIIILFLFAFLNLRLDLAAQQLPPHWNFRGKFLIAISDADMLASAYEDGRLGLRYGKDQLSIVPLDTTPDKYQAYTVEATNSVAGPPSVVDVTPNGRFAYVIETFGPRPGKSDEKTFADLINPKKPTKIQEVEIGDRPLSVNVNKDGSHLAISYHSLGGNALSLISIHRIKKTVR